MTIGQALERLQMQCCRCEYSTGQVRRKLLMWDMREKRDGKPGFLPQEIDGAVEALVKERFVDDERFAGAYVRDKARFAKWGPAKIGYNLRMLGVEQQVIKRALDESSALFGPDALEEVLLKKWKGYKESESLQGRKNKLMRFALGRGYDYGQIMEIMKKLG